MSLSREQALCIGLATKALPDTLPEQLIEALTKAVGLPLTQSKLASLSLEQYRQALPDHYSDDVLLASLYQLQRGEQAASNTSPVETNKIQLYRKGDMPHSIRVAVASDDGIYVNGQFSQCKQFYIYQVSALEQRLIAIRAAETDTPMKAEQKQHYRAEILHDCQVLYSQSIGGPAAAKVIKEGVHPIKLNSPAFIADIIEQIQHVLSTSPPPWLAKSMGVSSAVQTAFSTEEESL